MLKTNFCIVKSKNFTRKILYNSKYDKNHNFILRKIYIFALY